MNKILEIKFGSHLYGTDTPSSDLDLKGLYLPSAKEIVLGTYKQVISYSRKKKENERNKKEYVDMEIFSLDRFLKDLMDGQTWALDFLFATPGSYTDITPEGTVIMKEIFENRDRLLTRNVNAFVSYARKQAHKYGIKGTRMDALKRAMAMLETFEHHKKLGDYEEKINALVKECGELVSLEKTALVSIINIPNPNGIGHTPHLEICGRKIGFTSTVKTAKECYTKILGEYGARAKMAHLEGGVDWKALSHAIRVNGEALELLKTGHITFPRPEREMLIKVKTGQFEPNVVYSIIEEGMIELTEAHQKSLLRETPDKEWAEEFIYRVYFEIVKRG